MMFDFKTDAKSVSFAKFIKRLSYICLFEQYDKLN